MKQLKILNGLIPLELKKKVPILFFGLFIGMIFEILGIGVLIPVLNIIVGDKSEFRIPIINTFFEILYKIENTTILFLVIVIFFVVRSIYLSLMVFYQNKFSASFTKTISNKLFKKILDLEYSFFLKTKDSQINKLFQVELSYFALYISSFFLLITEYILALSIIITLIIIEPIATIVSFAFLLIFAGIYYKLTKEFINRIGIQRENIDNGISKIISETLTGIKEIYLFNAQNYFNKEFISLNNKKAKVATNQNTISRIPRYFLEMLAVITICLFSFILFTQNYQADKIIVSVGVLVVSAFRMIPSVNRILVSTQKIKFYTPSVDSIRNLLIEKNRQTLSDDNIIFKNILELKNLKFNYGEKTIINDLNFKINKGEYIGLVGNSGSGKSTLINLLTGLLNINSGEILVDKKNVKNLNSISTVVPQFPFILNGNLGENISFQKTNFDVEKIKEVIIKADLKSLVDIENILDFEIKENGKNLSGGQKQRICIARALYQEKEIIIFDEPTSSLDKESTIKVLQTISKIKGEKTIIHISHDQDSLKNCDRVVELKNKKVVKYVK